MKAMGITRRIDDLGRLCIPKEFRRTMHIKEGDALEMLVCEQGLLVQKCNQDENPVGFNMSEKSSAEEGLRNVVLIGPDKEILYLALTPDQLRFLYWIQEDIGFYDDYQIEEVDATNFQKI